MLPPHRHQCPHNAIAYVQRPLAYMVYSYCVHCPIMITERGFDLSRYFPLLNGIKKNFCVIQGSAKGITGIRRRRIRL